MPEFEDEIIESDPSPKIDGFLGILLEQIMELRMKSRDRAQRRELGVAYRKVSALLSKKIDQTIAQDSQEYLKITGELQKTNQSIVKAIEDTRLVADSLNMITDTIQTITELTT